MEISFRDNTVYSILKNMPIMTRCVSLHRYRCKYDKPQECPMDINGTECTGHGQCNNLNQCFCDRDWGIGGLCGIYDPISGNDWVFIGASVEFSILYSWSELHNSSVALPNPLTINSAHVPHLLSQHNPLSHCSNIVQDDNNNPLCDDTIGWPNSRGGCVRGKTPTRHETNKRFGVEDVSMYYNSCQNSRTLVSCQNTDLSLRTHTLRNVPLDAASIFPRNNWIPL